MNSDKTFRFIREYLDTLNELGKQGHMLRELKDDLVVFEDIGDCVEYTVDEHSYTITVSVAPKYKVPSG